VPQAVRVGLMEAKFSFQNQRLGPAVLKRRVACTGVPRPLVAASHMGISQAQEAASVGAGCFISTQAETCARNMARPHRRNAVQRADGLPG